MAHSIIRAYCLLADPGRHHRHHCRLGHHGVGGQLGLGRLADGRSLAAGYVVGGAATALAWPLVWAVRRIGGEADAIVPHGARAGTCAAQGLPANTQTGSQSRDVVATGQRPSN